MRGQTGGMDGMKFVGKHNDQCRINHRGCRLTNLLKTTCKDISLMSSIELDTYLASSVLCPKSSHIYVAIYGTSSYSNGLT